MKKSCLFKITWYSLILGSFVLISSCQDDRETSLSSGDNDKIKVYVGDELNGKYLVLFAVPKDFSSGGICAIDNATNDCEQISNPDAENFGTDKNLAQLIIQNDFSLHQAGNANGRVELKASIGKKYRVQARNGLNSETLSREFTIGAPGANSSSTSGISGQWRAVVVSTSGNSSQQVDVYANARKQMKSALEQKGFQGIIELSGNFQETSQSGSPINQANADELKNAFTSLNVGNGDGCLLYISSKAVWLDAATLRSSLQVCIGKPTVIILSHDNSGSLNAQLANNENNVGVISSAGLSEASVILPNAQRPLYDECLFSAMPISITWSNLESNAKQCVAQKLQSGISLNPISILGSGTQNLSIARATGGGVSGSSNLGQYNIDLFDEQNSKVSDLKTVAGGKSFLWIKFSDPGCGPCGQLDQATLNFSKSDCGLVTLTGNLADWKIYSPSRGKNAYQVNILSTNALFGIQSDVPNSVILDTKSGKIVDQYLGPDFSQKVAACQQ